MLRKKKLEELGRLSESAYLEEEKFPLIVILDNIRSAHNIGSIYRTSDAFFIDEIWLVGISSPNTHKDLRKTAIGAERVVKNRRFESIAECLAHAEANQVEIVSIEQSTASIPLHELKLSADVKTAIVFGNEVDGVDDEFLIASKQIIELEQKGTKHSLNVSVCAGIVLHHCFRQLSAD